MKTSRYIDINLIENEARKDYVDRHSCFVKCEKNAKKGEKLKVKVVVGDAYKHPDDFDHYISWIQLWDGEQMLAQTNMLPGSQGNQPSNLEVDFYIVPQKNLKLMAHSYCTKHGLWESEEIFITVE